MWVFQNFRAFGKILWYFFYRKEITFTDLCNMWSWRKWTSSELLPFSLSFKNIFPFQQYHICLKLSNKPVLVISSYKLQQFKPSEEPVSITYQKVLWRYWPHCTGIFYHNTIGLICWLLGLFSGRYFLK